MRSAGRILRALGRESVVSGRSPRPAASLGSGFGPPVTGAGEFQSAPALYSDSSGIVSLAEVLELRGVLTV